MARPDHYFLVPAEDRLIVRDPKTMAILPKRADASHAFNRKPNTSYWRRRLKAGEVKRVDADSIPETPSANAKKLPPAPPRRPSPAVTFLEEEPEQE